MSPMSDEDLTSATGEVELRAARVGMVFVLLVCAGFAVIGLCLLAGLYRVFNHRAKAAIQGSDVSDDRSSR